MGNGDVAFAGCCRAQDVDPRQHGAVVVGGPAHEGEDAARRERNDTQVAVDHVFLVGPAEPDPVFDALLDPHELDMGEFGRRFGREQGAEPARLRAVVQAWRRLPDRGAGGARPWETVTSGAAVRHRATRPISAASASISRTANSLWDTSETSRPVRAASANTTR